MLKSIVNPQTRRFLCRRPFLMYSLVIASLLVVTAFLMLSTGQAKKPASERTIVVVGGGMAGLAAAIEASRKGAKVVLIEGQKFTGGNSAKATSGINGCQTRAQAALGINDSHDLFFGDTLKAGHNENDQRLVDVLVHHANESVEFLNGLGLDLDEVSIGGGHSVARTHAFSMPPDGKLKPFGATVMRTTFQRLTEFKASYEAIDLPDRLRFLFETRVESLITDGASGRVVGVRVVRNGAAAPAAGADNQQNVDDAAVEEIAADAVVLATGGFCNDHDPRTSLLVKYAGDKIRFPTTNGPFADGSGMKMAERIGARLIDMEKIQIHPTGFVDPKDPKAQTKFLAAEALRGSGAILLNERGERFANELGLRDYLTGEILNRCALNETTGTHTAYMVLNQEAVDKFGRPAFEFYWKVKQFFKLVDDVGQLARLIDVPSEKLTETFSAYNGYGRSTADPFGKRVFPVGFDPTRPFYLGTVTPVLHYSMGGVRIDADARVLRAADDRPLGGLYAAGEVVGGVHGGNRLSGNSYLDCVVFGRIAGVRAAED